MAEAHDAHLAVLMNRDTGLYHGALYLNRPTPSGSDRYLLAASLNEGHASSRAAAEAANAAFPDVEPLDLSKVVDDGLPEGGLGLPRNAYMTRIRPRRAGDPQDGAPEVEVSVGGRNVDVALTGAQLDRMLDLGHVEEESSSGRDPNLYYVYDHYVLTPVGRRIHCRRAD